MSDKTVTTASNLIPSFVMGLLTEAVHAEASSYGARKAFAAGINDVSPEGCAWYSLESMGQKLPENIKAIKTAYYDGLKSIGYSNPSNAWKMVRQYAKADAAARAMFGEIAETETEGGEGEGEGGDTREARTLTLRFVEELTTLHKAAMKAKDKGGDEYSPKIAAAHHKIVEALKCMGVDIGM